MRNVKKFGSISRTLNKTLPTQNKEVPREKSKNEIKVKQSLTAGSFDFDENICRWVKRATGDHCSLTAKKLSSKLSGFCFVLRERFYCQS